MIRRIDKLNVLPGRRLELGYVDGSVVVVNFENLIERGGVWAALGDAEFFTKVRIGERGRTVEWPGELDFCADALWLQGQQADAARLAS